MSILLSVSLLFSLIMATYVFEPPTTPTCKELLNNCTCRKQIDISFVIDFSASIKVQDMQNIRKFMTQFLSHFQYGPTGIDIAITHFWTHTFTNFSFSRDANVETAKKAIADFQCCIPEIPNNLKKPCCNKQLGTSISSGIRHGGDQIARYGRDGASRVMIVLTDGYHNTGWNRNLNRGSGGCVGGCVADLRYALQYVRRVAPRTITIALGVGRQNKFYLKEIASRIKGRFISVNSHEELASAFVSKQVAQKVCGAVPGFACLNQLEVQPSKQDLVPPPQTLTPPAANIAVTRNNDRYFPYNSFSDNWLDTIPDIQSLPLKSIRFDPENLILMVVQRTKIPYIVQDVFTGLDIRTGGVVWGPSESGRVHSRFVGLGFGHAFYIGRELPTYYVLKTEAISKARYSIFALNTSNGRVTSVQPIPQESYTDNTQENSQICFSEASNAFFIIEDDGLIVYKVDFVNNKVTFTLKV
jgi:hypothetical protein